MPELTRTSDKPMKKGREGENGDELQTRARAHPLEMVMGGGKGVAVKSCKKCERISAGKRDCEQAEWTRRWDIYEPVGICAGNTGAVASADLCQS